MNKIAFLLVLFQSLNLFSQNITFQGIVKDTLNETLEMANVMAINQATKAVDAYSITNDKGKFQLSLKANSSYNVRFTFLGLKTRNVIINTKTENISQTITLNNDATQLAGVEIFR